MTAKVLEAKPRERTLSTGLSSRSREEIAGELKEVLANTMMLQLKSQVFHWNVVGPVFYSLHKLTEEHYKDLFEAVDVIAERIRALGHMAPLSLTSLKPSADLKDESRSKTAAVMVETLIDDHECLIRDTRNTAKKAEEHGDLVTTDMLTQRLQFHEQAVWMLRAIAA